MAESRRLTALVILGASGNLAAKKLYPAIFKLFRSNLLPGNFRLIGYDPRPMDDDQYLRHVGDSVKPSQDDNMSFSKFEKLVSYVCSNADGEQPFQDLNNHLVSLAEDREHDRLFYLALPPKAYVSVSEQLRKHCTSQNGSSRLVVEKPFGRNSRTSLELQRGLEESKWTEDQIFRIDHYLGKEMLKNMLTLRFSNSIFGGAWSHDFIDKVEISVTEAFGTEGRGGYFDDVGIIRDVVQNHMLQILALVAMEEPKSLSVEDLCHEKTRVLRLLSPMKMEHTMLGQYTKSLDEKKPGYKEDEGVPKDSSCPTFCKTSVSIDSERWRDVPFILRAGKALSETKAEVRIHFKHNAGDFLSALRPNELVVRIQPNEGITLVVNINKPDFSLQPVSTELDLTYTSSAIGGDEIAEAYEALILDALSGDFSLSIKKEELEALWDVCTPLLDYIDDHEDIPLTTYPYGSGGPDVHV